MVKWGDRKLGLFYLSDKVPKFQSSRVPEFLSFSVFESDNSKFIIRYSTYS